MINCITDTFDLTFKITDILTLIAVILTFLTLIQLKRQRESMYLPDLFIGKRNVEFFGFDLHEMYSDFNYSNLKKPNDNDTNADKTCPWLDLYIHNVGFGAAKYVKGYWKYDFAGFIDLIKNSIDIKEFELNKSKNDGINEYYLRHLSSDHFSSGSEYLALDFELDIVLPKNTIDESPRITIPDTYIDLLSYYIAFKYEMFNSNDKKQFIFDELIEIPELKLTLEYSDIGNKTYSKSMNFIFSISGKYDKEYHRMDFGNIELGNYHIDIKEVN